MDVTKGGSASGVDELLNGLTALIAKAKGEAPPEEDVAKAASKKAAMDGYASKLKACGMDAAGVKMAMEAFKGFEFDVGPGGQAPLQKGKETDMENTAKSLSEEQLIAKTLEGVLAGIQKAKTFTPTRQAAMKSAMETLKGLLEDLESGAENKGNIPSAEEMAGQGSAPKDGKIGSGLQDIRQNAPVMKALEQLVEVTKGLASSLEEVKKTRAAPTNVAADGGADAKVVKKSMWSGVL